MKFKSYNNKTFQNTVFFENLPELEKKTLEVLLMVFQLKVNNYVLEKLIDWGNIPNDPIYKLVFPRKEMLSESDFDNLSKLTVHGSNNKLLSALGQSIKEKMFPNIVSTEQSIPQINGNQVVGAYRNFSKNLLLFPAPMVRTCHSYCSYCFRWITFDDIELQNLASYTDPKVPIPFLQSSPEITDVIFTGADPMIVNVITLKKYIEPILEVESVKVINITTKSLAWWPYRFTTDKDADEILNLFKHIISKGKHINILAHFSHVKEVESDEVKEAAKRIRDTGAFIRCQSPLVKDINDSA